MSAQDAAALTEITYIIGGSILALLTFVSVTAWRIGRSLQRRDDAIEKVTGRLAEHEAECVSFREETASQFADGRREFKRINRSLGRIEGKLGIETPADDG